ncbi:ABC transporter ATP-binding protein [Paenibacillus sabinae]|uniref:ABC transporter ATP-binding protein n=1 Tax=Paenibacillus sabinae T27 TaxID=1268072 RepID=X4ZQS0_9BACL|nr:ABC transporter ATP-binding protein [Paenibacillus sabinae]AHV99482.1 ABC transporter ATP-binding protein [Paenibacillus sabinae T27]
MNALEMRQVSKKYWIHTNRNTMVLNNIDIVLGKNEFVGIMGTSGSGKTTLLNVASGIDKCDGGDIFIGGQNICAMKKNELSLFRRNHIGMVFQDFNLLSSLTVRENIMVPLILDKNTEKLEGDDVERLAKMLDIGSILDQYPYEISGGQQQRAAICRAIINDPEILFADEPTGNLDSQSSKRVLSYFELIHQTREASILMVTHDPFSARHCQRVIFLQDGSVLGEISRQSSDKESFMNRILDVLQRGHI